LTASRDADLRAVAKISVIAFGVIRTDLAFVQTVGRGLKNLHGFVVACILHHKTELILGMGFKRVRIAVRKLGPIDLPETVQFHKRTGGIEE
jgi:hypothetical protein